MTSRTLLKSFLKNTLPLLFLSCMAFLNMSGLQAQDWKQVRSSKGIDVFTRTVEGSSYKAFKSVATIEAPLEAFVALIQDVDALKDWGYKLKSSELLSRKGDTVQVYFAEAKAPFPYRNRYGIYLNTFSWDPTAKVLLVGIDLLEDYSYDAEDLVLMKGSGFWKVTKRGKDQLKIEFEMHVDPGKGIPGWLSNLFADESPYETMLSVMTEIKKSKYQGKRYEFLE